jgi:hypothetical protein
MTIMTNIKSMTIMKSMKWGVCRVYPRGSKYNLTICLLPCYIITASYYT